MNQCLHAVQIIEICESDPRDQRLKRLLVMVISCNRQGTHASSVEGMAHGNDLVDTALSPLLFGRLIVGVPSGNFQSALNGFGPAVGKEHLIHAGSRQELFSRFDGRHIVK